MNHDTRRLLEECNAGCKMAIGSMKQVQGFSLDEELRQVISCYQKKHEVLEEKSSQLLKEAGNDEKKPNPMAAAFSWITTEVKVKMNHDSSQVARLMMDGCNMGIQTIVEHQNDLPDASLEAKRLAMELVHMEETFVKELKKFL